MKLSKLDAKFLRHESRMEFRNYVQPDGSIERQQRQQDYFIPVETFNEAQGVEFLCPKCFETNQGEINTHLVVCWFKNKGIPDTLDPKPGRWNPQGTCLDDLTFVGPGAVSVQLNGGCNWHGFVKNGDAV